jgi:tetrahydromethanopterin S-methyltransferase subunit G
LESSCKNNNTLDRLIRQFDKETLAKVVSLFSQELEEFILDYNTDINFILQKIDEFRNISKIQLKHQIWKSILSFIILTKNKKINILNFVETHLFLMSDSNNIKYNNFVNDLFDKTEYLDKKGERFESGFFEILKEINSSLAKDIEEPIENQYLKLNQRLEKINNQVEIMSNEIYINNSGLILLWPSLAKDIEEPIENQYLKLNQRLEKINNQVEIMSNEIYINNSGLILLWPSLAKDIEEPIENQYLKLNQRLEKINNQVEIMSNEIYINNSGLILLWPFLKNFFIKLGFLDKNIFIDNLEQKAVLLSQYIIDVSEEIPEYLLPLNKILCGIDLLEPTEMILDITEKEKSECEYLLSAVIHNWPILKNISIEGFRRNFLRREGVLKLRDGNYLLQVKNKTYDIVLDKLPWSINVIKMPWMNNILYIEW